MTGKEEGGWQGAREALAIELRCSGTVNPPPASREDRPGR